MSNVELPWSKQARCTGKTHLFFAPQGETADKRRIRERTALIICMGCPVMLECRQYARENDELGIWGGETEDQRYRLGYLNDPFMRRKYRDRDKRKRNREKERHLAES